MVLLKYHRKSQGKIPRKTEELENGFHTESWEERALYGLAKGQPGDVTAGVLEILNSLLKKMVTRDAVRSRGTAAPHTQALLTAS